jgi:hypothetical protein
MADHTITVSYGSYNHNVPTVNNAGVSSSEETLFTDLGVAYATRRTIQLAGDLNGDGTHAIDALMDSMIAAYAIRNQEFKVAYTGDNTGEVDAFHLNPSECDGGVRVISPPSFDTQGAALATGIPYRITLQGDVRLSGAPTLRMFRETLTFSGGDAEYGHIETRVGLPVKQGRTANKVYSAVQEGMAIGLYSWPTIPSPKWPANQMRKETTSKTGPTVIGDGERSIDYVVTWRYEFESSLPMTGNPSTG